MKTMFKEEREKLKKMNFAEKRWYVWEYYKLHILGLLVVFFLVGSIVNSRLNPAPMVYLYIAWAGVPATSIQLNALTAVLHDITYNPDAYRIFITNYSRTDNPRRNRDMEARFAAFFLVEEMDIYITTREGAEVMATQGFIRTVCNVKGYLAEINPQIHAEIESRLLPSQAEYYEYPQFIAISLEGSLLLTQLGIDTSNIYLCVFSNTQRFYEIAKTLEVLLYDA